MASPKELTRTDVLRAADRFRWTRKLPKWTVLVNDHELPARPLVLEAAGVPPNDPINSHQAVAILRSLGFETRYSPGETREARNSKSADASESATKLDLLIQRIEQISSRVPDEAWEEIPRDLSKNVDHYLYGAKKTR